MRRLSLRRLSIGVSSGGLSIASFMAQQSSGFWYDFTSPDRLFQENIGPTPANDPSEVIGLALSQRTSGGQTLAHVVSAAPELAPNTTFASTSSCTRTVGTATMAAVAGRLRLTAVDVNQSRWSMPLTGLTVGASYRVRCDVYGDQGIAANTSVSAIATLGSSVAFTAAAATARTDVLFFTATATTMYVGGSTSAGSDIGDIAEWANPSAKEVSRYPATQGTTSFKPVVQSGGGKGDAADDRLDTGYASAAGDAFLLVLDAQVPASIAATQVFCGAMDGSSNGDYLGVTTAGALRCKVGQTVLDSTGIDLRGGTHDLGYWTDGATLYLYADGVIVASGAWTGSRPATTWNLFALNNNGVASSFSGATVRRFLRGAQALTVSLANRLATSP